MSRAFVKEQDDRPEELPDRPVSSSPNYVTPRGLALIDGKIAALRQEQARAQQLEDKAEIARMSRELRYWAQRRASAQLVVPPKQPTKVTFGCRVFIRRDDGRKQSFAIVGEDEADPVAGLISYLAPVARALIGKEVGDEVAIAGAPAEIVAIE